MASANRNSSPNLPPGLPLGLGIAIAAIVLLGAGRHLLDRWHYNTAMHAKERADCYSAIENFDSIIYAFRLIFNRDDYVNQVREKKAECELFQKAVENQQSGKGETALLDYITLANVYEDSVLIDPIRQQILNLFEEFQMVSLATPEVCARIQGLMTQNLLSRVRTQATDFYLACGSTFEANSNYGRAIDLYEKLRQKNSLSDTQTQMVEKALARAIVSDTRHQGAREVGPPSPIAYTADGTTVVEIQNDAPREMKVTFSGPAPKFEKIESCEDCVIHKSDEKTEDCPNKGPVKEYNLTPGQHQISVDYIEIGNEKIEFWVGDWTLDEGIKYSICFTIIDRPIDFVPEA